MAKLVLMQKGQTVDIPLEKDETLFGRLPECDVKLNSGMISRHHAKLVRAGGGYTIADLGSGNGTFLNGEKLAGEPKEIKDGDRIKLGPALFRFEAADSKLQSGLVSVPAAARLDKPSDAALAGTATVSTISEALDFEVPTLAEAPETEQSVMSGADVGDGFGVLSVNPEQKLQGVLEITKALSDSFDPDEILPKILEVLLEIFPAADRGFIFTKNEKGDVVQRAAKLRREDDEDASFRMSRTIRDKVLVGKEAVLSADASSDSRFTGAESLMGMSIRSVMAVPMLDRNGDAVGLINVDTSNQLKSFTEDDLQLMVAVAGQASMSYQSALLLQSYVQKQKQDGEMNIAQGVQHALLPPSLPQPDGWDLFASYDSAQAVGGDYYDAFPLPSGKLLLAFGDVAGKGVPGALVMSRISSVVRSTMEFLEDPLPATEKINTHMCARAAEGRFVTFVLAVLDPGTGDVEFVNAGHMEPMIRRADGTIEEPGTEEIGVPIGVMEDFPFEKVHVQLGPGDSWVVYTDGVSEAMAPDEALYGMDRLRSFVAGADATSAETLGLALREDVRRHANGREQNDDVTMMVVRKT